MVVDDEVVDGDVDDDEADDDAEHCTLQTIKTMKIYVDRIFALNLLRYFLSSQRVYSNTRAHR